jgi:serine/threonine-protein kinase
MPSDRDNPSRATRPLGGAEGQTVVRFSMLSQGTVLAGRYRILHLLGRGGCGEVFRAEDTLAGDEVALKVLYPHAATRDASLERLRRELRNLRALHHPGIVGVRDVGEHEQLLFLAMELLEGETLAERLSRDGPLGGEGALRVLDGMLSALVTAHRAGMVHRDVKPSNVFLARDRDARGEHERVVLLDFGLARRDADARLTQSGQVVGTLEYVAPEQARGDPVLTPATDLYAAGVVLWEMLTGEAPFSADSPAGTLAAHLHAPLPPPRRALRGAPAWLRDLAAWMLEKDPERRPASAGVALERLRARRGRSLAERLRGLAGTRLRKPGVAALTGGAALLALALAALPWSLHVDGDRVLRQSALGVPVDEVSLPWPSTHLVEVEGALPWTRRYVGALHPPGRLAFLESYPSGLYALSPLSRRAEPLLIEGRKAPPRHGFPYYDQRMNPAGLFVTPWRSPRGERLLLYVLQSVGSAPCKALLMTESGALVRTLEHPGHLNSRPTWMLEEGSGEPALILFSGTNTALGARKVLVALSPRVEVEPHQTTRAPPFLPGGLDLGRPDYYTFTSLSSSSPLKREGTTGWIVGAAGDVTMRFDLRTGVPLEARHRGGLTREAWRARQGELLDLLHRIANPFAAIDPRVGARWLERFAERRVGPAQRGVALARAARLWQRAGEHERALPLVRRAMEVEPRLSDHRRRLVDLETRLGDWRSARTSLEDRSPGAPDDPRLMRDLTLAALLTGSDREALAFADRVVRADTVRRSEHYAAYACLLAALHAGNAARLPACTEAVEFDPRTYPEFCFLEAMILATADPPRPRRALAALERHEQGWGAGTAVPVVPLRAHLARLGAGDPPTGDALRLALERQERAARTSLLGWYMLRWARKLATGEGLPDVP